MPLYKDSNQDPVEFYKRLSTPPPTEEEQSSQRFGALEQEYKKLKVANPDRDPYVLEQGMAAIRKYPIAPYNAPGIDELEQVGRDHIKANQPGFLKGTAQDIVGGLTDVPEMWGRAVRGLPGGQPAGVSGDDASSRAIEGAEQFKAETPFVQDKQGLSGASRSWHQGVRSATTSLASKAPAMIAGGVAGFFTGGPIGAVIGTVAGYALSGASMFGLAEYDKSMERLRKEKPNMPLEEQESYALSSALWEAGPELAADIVQGAIAVGTAGVGTPAAIATGNAVKIAIKEMFKTGFKQGFKSFGKRASVFLGAEISSEMLTAGMQAENAKKAGIGNQRFFDAATEAFGPATVASLIFLGLSEGGGRISKRSIGNALENPEADVKKRLDAANDVERKIRKASPELADQWNILSLQAIANKEAISIDDTALQTPEGSADSILEDTATGLDSGDITTADLSELGDQNPELRPALNELTAEHVRKQIETNLKQVSIEGIGDRVAKSLNAQFGIEDTFGLQAGGLRGEAQAEWRPGTVIEQSPMDKLKVKLAGHKIGKDAKFTPEGGQSAVDAMQTFEDEAGKTERLRQSAAGAEGLKEQLGESERPTLPEFADIQKEHEGAPLEEIEVSAIEKPTPDIKKSDEPIESLIDQYEATGRSATRYPQKKEISVDGRTMSEEVAVKKMKGVVNKEAPVEEQASDKEPWEITKDEYLQSRKGAETEESWNRPLGHGFSGGKAGAEKAHAAEVLKAMVNPEKEVPESVLKDYLDLVEKYGAAAGVSETKRVGGSIKGGKKISIKEVAAQIKQKHGDNIEILKLSEGDTYIELDGIRVAKGKRGSGIGADALDDIKAYADETGKPIVLEARPEKRKKAALAKFYRDNGFKKPGRNRNYALPRHTHIYTPDATAVPGGQPTIEKKPGEMSRNEWSDAKNNLRGSGAYSTLRGGSAAQSRAESIESLNYGLEPTFDEEFGEYVQVDHRAVIQQALKEGKPVPPAALKEYGLERPEAAVKEKPSPEEVLATAKRGKAEKDRKSAAKATSFRMWVKYSGGIQMKDKTWAGEIRDIKGRAGMKGMPVGIFKKTALGIDEMTLAAIDAGWLPEGSTENDFMAALENNPHERALAAGGAEWVDKQTEIEYAKQKDLERKAGESEDDITSAERDGEAEGIQQANEEVEKRKSSRDSTDEDGFDWGTGEQKEPTFKLTPEEPTEYEKAARLEKEGVVKRPEKSKSKAVFKTDETIEQKGAVGKQGELFGPDKDVNLDLFSEPDKPLFSKSLNPTPKGMREKAVQNYINRTLPKFPGMDAEVIVKNSLKDINPANIERWGIPLDDVIGGFHVKDGKTGKKFIYLIAENIGGRKDIGKVFLEEIGHNGIYNIIGNDVLTQIYSTYAKDKDMVAMLKKYTNIDTATEKGKVLAGDEWLAKGIANDTLPAKVWQQIVRAVRKFMRGINPNLKYSTNEIKQMIRDTVAGRSVERVGGKDGVNQFSQPIRMSLKNAAKNIMDNPNFVKWFGDSKVVGEDGKPLVVYHGTADKIRVFKKSERGRTTGAISSTKGYFFSSNKRVAKGYSEFARPKEIDALKAKHEKLEKIAQKKGTNEAWNEYYDAYSKYETLELGYPAKESSDVLELYLSINNPLVHDYGGKDFRDKSYSEIIDKAIRDKKDGVIFKNTYDGVGEPGTLENPIIDVYVAFHPTQIKSIYNTGAFDPADPDIRMSYAGKKALTADETAMQKDEQAPVRYSYASNEKDNFSKDVMSSIKMIGNTMSNRNKKWRNRKPDITAAARMLSTPLMSFQKIPSMKRLFDAGVRRTDIKNEQINDMTQNPETEESYTKNLNLFKKKDKIGYRKLKKYLKHRDQNQIGYSVKQDGEEFKLLSPKGKEVGIFPADEAAWRQARISEGLDHKQAGASDQSVKALLSVRTISDNGFNLLMKNMRDLVKSYEERGMDIPSEAVNIEGKKVEVDLKMALAKMGEIRGYYMPRIRESGRYHGYATKKGANPVFKKFDTKTALSAWHVVMERDGYRVTKDISKAIPEDVFQMLESTMGTQQIINKALDRIDAKGLTLEDFGLKGTYKDQEGRRDFVVEGPRSKKVNKVLNDMGGRWYPKDELWHFRNPGQNFDNRLAKAISNVANIVDLDTQTLFAKNMIEQVADIIKGRGARAHMIKRNDVKGVEVWEGYEEDPAIAMARYAQGLAAGEAKKQSALEMIQAFTGTDVSWAEYKADREGAKYEKYIAFMKDRGISATEQGNAFKEGASYIKHNLRNDEAIDRIMGTIKGAAVLKFLAGRVAAPLVNLTALATSVPAVMSKVADIPLYKSFSHMGKAITLYGTYLYGDKKALPKDVKLMFDEIHNKGWHKPQYNQEAFAAIKGKVGTFWNNMIEVSMMGFGVTEQLNRVATIAGTVLGVRAKGKYDLAEALEIAKEVSDKAHSVYSKANDPGFTRGADIGRQTAKSFYMFKRFSHQYLLMMKELYGDSWKPEHKKALAYMAISPAILAGSGAFILTPVIKAAASALLGSDDPEEEWYDWLDENIGRYAGTVGRLGLFGLAGINIKGSLELGISDIPTNLKDVLGAPGSMVSDVFYKGPKDIWQGDTSKGIEKMLPNALAAPFKAYREYTEGITSRSNAPIFYGKDPVKADTMDAIYRALSFNPAKISTIREKLWNEKKIEFAYKGRRNALSKKLKRMYLKGNITKADWINFLTDVREYNSRVAEHKMVGIIPTISKEWINNTLRRAFRPTRKELRKRSR